jgi:hypothetical protein
LEGDDWRRKRGEERREEERRRCGWTTGLGGIAGGLDIIVCAGGGVDQRMIQWYSVQCANCR